MTRLYHRLRGNGPPLILGPSLGTSLAVWEPQLAGLAREHRVLRWDLPGHGRSPAGLLPDDGTATVAGLATRVLDLADEQGWQRFDYAGISLGGAVGLHLAVHHPERLSALALVCSSAHFGTPAHWRQRAEGVRAHGVTPLLESTAGRWFHTRPERGRRLLDDLQRVDPDGYAACCDALASYDLRAALPGIIVPTLAVAGLDDPATPPAHARELAAGIPDGQLAEIARAAHLANVDQPRQVTAALRSHLGPGVSASADVPRIARTSARHTPDTSGESRPDGPVRRN